MIVAQIYAKKSKILRRVTWGFRFVSASNGQKYGHDYNDRRDAEKAVRRIVDEAVPVRLEVVYPSGLIENKGLIR